MESTAKVSLIAETNFNSISIIFENGSFATGEEFDFNFDNVFADSSVVLAALESGSNLTVFDSEGNEWAADYEMGNIHIGSSIPEPSIYAAVFGVLALALLLIAEENSVLS